LAFLVVGHCLVLGLGEFGTFLCLCRRGLLRFGRLVGIAFRRRGRQLGLHSGERTDAQACGEGDGNRELFHGLLTPPQCCVCACGAGPDFAATLPDLTSSYQYWWCSLAQVSSVTPSRMLR